MSKEQKQEIINNHTSYMGLIDEHFHTLIYPKSLGLQKFWNVICCYTRAYLYLTKHMLDKISENITYTEILTNPQKIFKKWIDYAQKYKGYKNDNYYSVIKGKRNINIITTNYTPLCESISGNNNIAYVHGKFSWFEEPYEMKVYDISEENFAYPKDSLLFPYISIQSGIKPIIEKKQLNEYSKMLDYLNKSSTLMIVGFKLNCDDNHINSLIRDFLETGKRVVVLNYENTVTENIVYRALRLDEKFDNLNVINVNENNALSEFEAYITKNIERSEENQK